MAETRRKRARDHILAFNMSPEESELLNRKVYLAGCSKQDYVLRCVFRQPITVCGTPQIYRRMALCLEELLQALQKRSGSEEALDVTLYTIQFLARIYGLLLRE